MRSDSDVSPVFKLVDLAKMYSCRLSQLGVDKSSKLNTAHLKNRILSHFPDMQAVKQGRDVLLAFIDDIGVALKKTFEQDFDDEGRILSNAAKIIRREMVNTKCKFPGKFNTECQKDSVPQSLVSLVEMILGGANIKTQSNNSIEAQITLTIAQLFQFNFTVRRRDESVNIRHSVEREPPLPVYLGLLLHAETRKRTLIDKLYDLGLSISYDRVLSISTEMGNRVSAMYEVENVVCPPILRRGIFTTSAVDNIDHNPSSTTAKGAFHGTGISLFQHPTCEHPGEMRNIEYPEQQYANKSVPHLPDVYTSIPPIVLHNKQPDVPAIEGPITSDKHQIPNAMEAEFR